MFVICFDIGGTILQSKRTFATSILEMISSPSPYTRRCFDECFLCGNYSQKEAIAEFGNRTGIEITEKGLTNIGKKDSNEYTIFPDALHALHALQSHYIITLSNAVPWSFVDIAATDTGALIRQNFYSFNIRFAKPDQRAFEYVENHTACTPDQFFMVGDSISTDILPAMRRGWEPIFINRKPSEVTAPVNVRTVTSLFELPQLITGG